MPGANHFFDGKTEPLMEVIGDYLDRRLPGTKKEAAPKDAPKQIAAKDSAA